MNRRRFLMLTAAAAILPTVGRATEAKLLRWTGRCLGADAEIRLYHPDDALGREALAQSLMEIERLEKILSLFHPESDLVRLNSTGRIEAPPLDLVRVLEEARAISAASDGAFDVTVQPVWAMHADSLKRTGLPPSAAALDNQRRLVNWQEVEIGPQRVALARPGMAVTLNGIAQGYITDRVADRLRQLGFVNVLVDLGEHRALGPQNDGTPWQVAVRDPRHRTTPLRRTQLADGAMATSEALGSSFPGFGKYGHLIEPKTAQPALTVPSVTVWSPSASRADALSTAIAVAGPDKAKAILAAGGGTRAMLVDAGGVVTEI